jgi:hypothetical protein
MAGSFKPNKYGLGNHTLDAPWREAASPLRSFVQLRAEGLQLDLVEDPVIMSFSNESRRRPGAFDPGPFWVASFNSQAPPPWRDIAKKPQPLPTVAKSQIPDLVELEAFGRAGSLRPNEIRPWQPYARRAVA